MKILTLSELIGETIQSIRYKYTNENGLQEFHSFIKLINGIVFSLPIYDEETFLILTTENVEYYNRSYEEGKELPKNYYDKINGKKIEDIYFCYYNQEIELGKRAYFKLSNGYYITENNFGPLGLTNISLLILNQDQFEERIKLLGEEVRSYNNDIKTIY